MSDPYPSHIAYQLAKKCKSYANALHVADKFDAVNHDISSQMKDLVEPWQLSEPTHDPGSELPPYLVVIDALDEIKDNGGSVFLLNLLMAIRKKDLRGLKFLVTSWPDPKVAALCKSFASEAVCRLQDIPIVEAKSDRGISKSPAAEACWQSRVYQAWAACKWSVHLCCNNGEVLDST